MNILATIDALKTENIAHCYLLFPPFRTSSISQQRLQQWGGILFPSYQIVNYIGEFKISAPVFERTSEKQQLFPSRFLQIQKIFPHSASNGRRGRYLSAWSWFEVNVSRSVPCPCSSGVYQTKPRGEVSAPRLCPKNFHCSFSRWWKSVDLSGEFCRRPLGSCWAAVDHRDREERREWWRGTSGNWSWSRLERPQTLVCSEHLGWVMRR